MKQGIQDTLKNDVLRKYGCYFLCCLEYAGLRTTLDFTESEIEYLFNQCVLTKNIYPDDCFIINPVPVINLAAQMQLVTKVMFIDCNPVTDLPYIICNQKPGYTHFTLWTGVEVWDPLNPTRPAAKAYKPTSYRVFH